MSESPGDGTPIGRRARPEDLEAVTETLAQAFATDPVWGWTFPEVAQISACWRLCLRSAIPYDWVWLTPGGEAAALWIPPGRPELSERDDAAMEPTLRALMGADADRALGAFPAFDANHPQDEPHYYLSLLGTHPDHRGRGHGMRLLRENLDAIDAQRAPAYLESSNPVNVARYRRVGFEPLGEFTVPGGGPPVTTMWRPAR